jgi:integrase
LRQAPPLLSRLSTKGVGAKPYPLSWSEQDKLFKQLAQHLANAALFAVNTGCREQEICQLRWEWDVPISDLDISVFVLPESLTKTKTERVVVLNSIAQNVIKSQRGIHPKFVFVFKGKPKKKNTGEWMA